MAEAMTRTRAAMSALAADPSEERIAEAKAARAALSDVVDTHFAHEERDLEPMMAQSIDTPQLKKAQGAIRKTQSLPEAGGYLTWLLDDADPDARAFVYHGFRSRWCSSSPACSAAPTTGSPRSGADRADRPDRICRRPHG